MVGSILLLVLALTFLSILATGGALIGVKLTGRSFATFLPATTGVLVYFWLLPYEADVLFMSNKSFLGQGGNFAGVITQYLSGQKDALCFPSHSYCSILTQLVDEEEEERSGGSMPEPVSMPKTVRQCTMPVEANEPRPPLLQTG